jgi:hypothetical protein
MLRRIRRDDSIRRAHPESVSIGGGKRRPNQRDAENKAPGVLRCDKWNTPAPAGSEENSNDAAHNRASDDLK